jgi:SAM-dependent methyltransferase
MDGCDWCGAVFAAEEGTPRLMAAEARRAYTLEFSAGSWEETRLALERSLHDPGAGATRAGLPYHVDAGHATVLAALPVGSAVLEIGCGGGQCRQWMRGLGHRYVGTDVSKSRVLGGLRRHGGPYLLCDAHFLPFRDSSFDAVYCAAVFEHLACPALAMAEVFRVLRPGGVFCGNASFLEPWHDASFFHLSPLGAVQLLLQAGFEPLNVWPGRGYTGFRALGEMAFARALEPLGRTLGAAMQGLYGAQLLAGRLRRRVLRKPQGDPLLRRFEVAGATDWVARRPG